MKAKDFKFIGLALVLVVMMLLTGGCKTTNQNDVSVAQITTNGAVFVERERTEQKRLEYLTEQTKQETERVKLIASADTGGTTVTTEEGVTVETKNPNAASVLLAAQGQLNGEWRMANGEGNPTRAKPVIPLPPKQKRWWEHAGAFTRDILLAAINPAATVLGTKYSMDAQVRMRESDNERWIADSGNQLQAELGMYNAFSGFGNNMENVATTATGDMRVLGESGFGQMQILGSNYADAMAESHGYGMAAIRDITETAFENPVTNQLIQVTTESSSNSSTFTEQYPDWTQWPVVTPGP